MPGVVSYDERAVEEDLFALRDRGAMAGPVLLCISFVPLERHTRYESLHPPRLRKSI
jgi:hypothetical protein